MGFDWEGQGWRGRGRAVSFSRFFHLLCQQARPKQSNPERNATKNARQNRLDKLRSGRYASWSEKGGVGERIRSGKVGALNSGAPQAPRPARVLGTLRGALQELDAGSQGVAGMLGALAWPAPDMNPRAKNTLPWTGHL
jgi:hypothetical protein